MRSTKSTIILAVIDVYRLMLKLYKAPLRMMMTKAVLVMNRHHFCGVKSSKVAESLTRIGTIAHLKDDKKSEQKYLQKPI